ncbi:hypothetical protein E4U55_003711 [Claviceps digitariae]|nr:hypothetical protein E4U55_003711 [Claviceps digitariae]
MPSFHQMKDVLWNSPTSSALVSRRRSVLSVLLRNPPLSFSLSLSLSVKLDENGDKRSLAWGRATITPRNHFQQVAGDNGSIHNILDPRNRCKAPTAASESPGIHLLGVKREAVRTQSSRFTNIIGLHGRMRVDRIDQGFSRNIWTSKEDQFLEEDSFTFAIWILKPRLAQSNVHDINPELRSADNVNSGASHDGITPDIQWVVGNSETPCTKIAWRNVRKHLSSLYTKQLFHMFNKPWRGSQSHEYAHQPGAGLS